MASFLRFEEDAGIVTLTMNRPDERNALAEPGQFTEFVDACQRINRSPTARVAILTGAGTAFSAGGNIKAMQARLEAGLDPPVAIRQRYRDGIQQVTRAVYGLEVPTIAAVNGPAIGVGCDLACACDIRVASRAARFAVSFVKLGIVPGDGGAWFVPRVVGMARACELAFTGDTIDAGRAFAIGLVNEVVDHDHLAAEVGALARRIAANPGPAVRMTKRLLRESEAASLDALLERSAEFQAIAHHTPEHRAALTAALNARKPRSKPDA